MRGHALTDVFVRNRPDHHLPGCFSVVCVPSWLGTDVTQKRDITSEFDLEPIVEWKGVEAKNIISLALDGTMLRQLIEAPTSILGSCGDFISWHVTGS